jgi:hypothetical protein
MARQLVDVLEAAQEAAIDDGEVLGGGGPLRPENRIRRGLQGLGEADQPGPVPRADRLIAGALSDYAARRCFDRGGPSVRHRVRLPSVDGDGASTQSRA